MPGKNTIALGVCDRSRPLGELITEGQGEDASPVVIKQDENLADENLAI